MYLVLNMLMYITGVSGCGKSTLIEELDSSGFLKEMNIIMGTYAYGSGILPLIASSDFVALQKYIYHMMIAQHMVYQRSGYAMLLDRCPVDWECYTQTYMDLGLYKYMDVVGMQVNFQHEIDLKPSKIKAVFLDPPHEFIERNLVERKHWGKMPWANERGVESLIWEYQARWEILRTEGAQVLQLTTLDFKERLEHTKTQIRVWMGK